MVRLPPQQISTQLSLASSSGLPAHAHSQIIPIQSVTTFLTSGQPGKWLTGATWFNLQLSPVDTAALGCLLDLSVTSVLYQNILFALWSTSLRFQFQRHLCSSNPASVC